MKNENPAPKMMKVLLENYGIRPEKIALVTGANYYTVLRWAKEGRKPWPPYMEKLTSFYKKEKEKERRASFGLTD